MDGVPELATVRAAVPSSAERREMGAEGAGRVLPHDSGRPAAATVTRRKRAVFYNALRYAVALELLQANPLDRVK